MEIAMIHQRAKRTVFAVTVLLLGALGWIPSSFEGPLAQGRSAEPPSPKATADTPSKVPNRPAPGRYALLVGVTHFPNLIGADLEGPANDVLLIQKLLQEKFSFPPEGIVILSEAEGQKDPRKYPTRDNVKEQIGILADRVKAGDQVVVHLSSHGAQQPQAKNPEDPDPDGFDKILILRDVGAWDGGSEKLSGGVITGQELGKWLKPIPNRKASLWVNVDACFSGEMIRAVGERFRQVPMETTGTNGGLHIPKAVIERARERAEASRALQPEKTRGSQSRPFSHTLPGQEGVAIIYACQANERAPEKELPEDASDSRSYGVLTFTLNKVLTESRERPTFQELVKGIQAAYVHMGRTGPSPLVVGRASGQEVLGQKEWPGRSAFLVKKSEDGLTINAGALHGLTRESILAVYPPSSPSKVENRLGYLRIKAVKTYEADVEPCEYEGQKPPAGDKFVDGRCELVRIDYGDLKLPVAIDDKDPRGKPIPREPWNYLDQELKKLTGEEGTLVRRAARPEEAKWLVRFDDDKVLLVPADGWAGIKPETGSSPGQKAVPLLIGPVKMDARLGAWLKDSLTRIARAANLLKVAAATTELASDPEDTGAQIKVEVLRLADAANPQDQPLNGSGITLYNGDKVVYRISNPGTLPMDATLLYVDSGYGIDVLFPLKGENNRLLPKAERKIRLKIGSKTTGPEYVVVIALQAQDPPVDFSALAQPTLGGTERGLDTPLGKLLKNATYGTGGVRSGNREIMETYALQVVPLQVRPEKRPPQTK